MAVTDDESFVGADSVAVQNLYCGKSGDGGLRL